MSLLPSTISHGLPDGLKPLGEPPRDIRFSRREVDVVRDAWLAPARDTLREGDPHPHFPGCIIDELSVKGPFGSAAGQIWEYDMTSLGDARGERPTKILGRGKRRTLESGWDERGERVLSWDAEWKPCKGVSATNTIYCDAHGFADGRRIYFARKTGGSGISAQSSTSLGTPYFVCNRGTNQFQVSLTPGGAVHALGSDITACEVIAAEFALGAPHPDHATMYLCELSTQDEGTDWKTADLVYRGLEEDKPFHRLITVNGQQTSSSSPITIELAGGWMDPRYSSFELPEIVVTDTYLSTATLPTVAVPTFSTPPNPPDIISYVVSGDNLLWNYPYGWTLVACPQQATLSSQIPAHVYSLVYRYKWPVSLR